MNGNHPKTHMTIHARIDDAADPHQMYEGEATMSQAQQDYYKSLLGDEKARVSVSRDLSEKDYGNGGGVTVTVTLTCDQSHDKVQAAIGLAHQVSDSACWHYQDQLKQQLIQRGILK